MSTQFNQYSVDLKHFYSLLGSQNQQVVDAAFAYLEKSFQLEDNDLFPHVA